MLLDPHFYYICGLKNTSAAQHPGYEDENGEVLPLVQHKEAIEKEVYQSYDMVQPGVDNYVLKLIDGVKPSLVGPFDIKIAHERLAEYVEDPSESRNFHTIVTVTKGADIGV